MTKDAVGETLQKGQKRETSSNEKMPRNWQKRVGKSAAAQEKFIKQKNLIYWKI